MSTVDATSKWLDRASDLLNPILVKETRQAFKSRQFVVTFMLLLLACWVIAVFRIAIEGNSLEYGSPGGEFFAFFYFVLGIAIFVIVPFGAFRSLLTERDENTYELLNITTLSPRRIVWGKLFSALVQVFIYYSAIAPFIAFTSLLQGFDIANVTFILVTSMLISLGASMCALMLSTLARNRQWQAMVSIAVLAGLVTLFFTVVVGWFLEGLSGQTIRLDDPEFWWFLTVSLVWGGSYLVLFQQITTAQLTFETDNRSTGIRITCAGQFLLLCASVAGYVWYMGGRPFGGDDLFVFCVLAGVHWAVVGLFAVTESDFLSRRIRRSIPRNFLLRMIAAPFFPGGSRGLAYLLIQLGLVYLAGFGMAHWMGSIGNDFYFATSGLCCYIFIYLGLGAALGRAGHRLSSDLQPAHIRVLILLMLAGGCIAPFLPSALQLTRWQTGYSLLSITNPFVTLEHLAHNGPYSRVVHSFLLVGAGITLALNARGMLHGLADLKPIARASGNGPYANTNTNTAETSVERGDDELQVSEAI